MKHDSSFHLSLSANISDPSFFQDKDQFRQHLLPTLKNWFTTDQRQVHVLAITPGGGKTYTTAQALVESCHENPGFFGMLAIHTKKRMKQELESIKQIKQQLESVEIIWKAIENSWNLLKSIESNGNQMKKKHKVFIILYFIYHIIS